jgi:hypothetical protein
MMLEEDEEERTTFRTVVVLEFRMVVTDVLGEVVLGEVWPIELVEEVDVMLIGNEVGVDKVLKVELELLIDPARLGVEEAWLRVVTCEVGIDELVRIFEGSPLESSGIEVAADETQVEDDRIGLVVDVTEVVLKDREDMKATLVEDEADVEITADDVTPSADVGRFVDESGMEKDNAVLNNDDSDRDPDATELPGRREAEIFMAVVLVVWVVLVTVGLIPLPGTGFGSDTVNRPLEDVATALAVDHWPLIEPDEGREVSDTVLVPLIVIAVEVVRIVVCPPGSTDVRTPPLEPDTGREVTSTELTPLTVVAIVVVKVMICPPGRVDVSTTGLDEAGLGKEDDVGSVLNKLDVISTTVVV